MTVTTRCKTVQISGPVGYSIVRSLRQRLEILNTRRTAIAGDYSPHGIEITAYLNSQINDVHLALATMAAADFALVDGAKS
jgi:hypothetical protein